MLVDQLKKRKANGVVYTPQAIVSAVVCFLKDQTVRSDRILEPSVGDGAFITALTESGFKLDDLVAVDIDGGAIAKLSLAYPSAMFVAEDFLSYCELTNEKNFTLIIGNPPYIRSRAFSPEFRNRVDRLSESSGYPRKALKNAWAAFSVAAERCLADDGTLAFVVPYEMMHVSYGIFLQRELFSKFSRVDVFIPDTKAFKSIDQDAVLFIGRKRSDLPHGVYISRVESLEKLNLNSENKIDYTDKFNLSESLKSFLLGSQVIDIIKDKRNSCKKINDFCKSMAGIVTSANDYFILHEKEIVERSLSKWARPILKKSAYLAPGPVITPGDFEVIRSQYPACLLDFSDIEPENTPIAVQEYLDIGKVRKVHETYKSRHRRVWFHVPIVPPSPAFFFKRSHSIPRLCVNEAEVYVTDTAYQIEPKEGYSAKGICFSFYNSMSLLFAEIEGRFYGGGVLELTPNEFKKVPMVYTEPTDEDFEDFIKLATAGDVQILLNFGDEILVREHGFKMSELTQFRMAWEILREHRLRHGSST